MVLERTEELKKFKWYLKWFKHILIDRMGIAFVMAGVIAMDVLGNLIYEVATIPTYDEIDLTIEYIQPENATEDISSIEEYAVEDPIDMYDFSEVGYIDVNTQLNVRTEPSTDSDILTTLTWMDKIEYSMVNDDWAIIQLDNENVGYIASKYIVDEEQTWTKSYPVSGDKAKTYMDYRKITDRTSKQYALQQRASTDDHGLRTLRGRYMVAVGSYFGVKVGQYIDVVLSDGEVLKCIIGDAKQDIHTDTNNLHGLNGDTVEFIVNQKILKEVTDVIGNISDVSDEFDGKVTEVRVYDHIEK